MGYIEETGAAQHFRDARITTIYEGTTGIQANDFIGRKTSRDNGAEARAVLADVHAVTTRMREHGDEALRAIGVALGRAAAAVEEALDWMIEAQRDDTRAAHAAAVGYLKAWGLLTGGWQLARCAEAAARRLASGEGDADFMRAKIVTAQYYAANLLPAA